MSICNSIFQKSIYDLKLEDIEKFFSVEQEETSILEFKSGEVSLEIIHKEVSAFLNTEGGILIIGAPKETNKQLANGKTKKVCLGALTFSAISNLDTLIRSIASNIVPSPVGIKGYSISYQQGNIYILEIPQSQTPPHQVSNEGKYYIRLERDAKPAPHGIIEALFQKRQKPNLVSTIDISTRYNSTNSIFISFTTANISLTSAEKAGHIILLHGIRSIKNNPRGLREIDCVNEKVKLDDIHSDGILVKGISITIEVEVEPTMDFILISFGCYCKDCQLETRLTIFDLKTFQFTHTHDTKELNNSFTAEDIYSIYNDKRKEQIKNYLNNPVLSNCKFSPPVTLEQIHMASVKLNAILPTSYLDFLLVSNGFSCQINNNSFSFYNIESVSDQTFSSFIDENYIGIGETVNSTYAIYLNPEAPTFGFVPKFGERKGQYISIGETFYEILKGLVN